MLTVKVRPDAAQSNRLLLIQWRKYIIMGFSLTNHAVQNITQVPDCFIDTYMPQANGSFVKVYLYLLRHRGDTSASLTIENMADMLSNTEADIVRALRYWEKQGILSLETSGRNIVGISLLPLSETKQDAAPIPSQSKAETERIPSNTDEKIQDAPVKPDAGPNTSATIPERRSYSPLQAEALKKDSEIETCLSMVEALLGTTLGNAHMQLILYFMSDLGFSLDLVITLYGTALSRGKSNPRYIEAIALDWARKGIRTAQEAEAEASSFNGTYKTVSKALGIKRDLAPAEKAIIDKWSAYGFSDAILEEACSRTVLQSGDINLNYTSTILADWHKKGVTTLNDINDCDRSYYRQKSASAGKHASAGRSKNKFQHFPQREYSKNEYAELEKQLLHQ